MPLREYQCEKCKEVWEELRRDQTDPSKCPKCGAENAVNRKLSSGTAHTFKTGGFSTGY